LRVKNPPVGQGWLCYSCPELLTTCRAGVPEPTLPARRSPRGSALSRAPGAGQGSPLPRAEHPDPFPQLVSQRRLPLNRSYPSVSSGRGLCPSPPLHASAGAKPTAAVPPPPRAARPPEHLQRSNQLHRRSARLRGESRAPVASTAPTQPE